MKRILCGVTCSTVCAVMLLLFLAPPVGAADASSCCISQPPMYYDRTAFTMQANSVQSRVTCMRVSTTGSNDNTSHLCAKVSGTHWECLDEKDKASRQITNWPDLNNRYTVLCGACSDLSWTPGSCYSTGE